MSSSNIKFRYEVALQNLYFLYRCVESGVNKKLILNLLATISVFKNIDFNEQQKNYDETLFSPVFTRMSKIVRI